MKRILSLGLLIVVMGQVNALAGPGEHPPMIERQSSSLWNRYQLYSTTNYGYL